MLRVDSSDSFKIFIYSTFISPDLLEFLYVLSSSGPFVLD